MKLLVTPEDDLYGSFTKFTIHLYYNIDNNLCNFFLTEMQNLICILLLDNIYKMEAFSARFYARSDIKKLFELAVIDKADHEYGFFYHQKMQQIQFFTKKDLENQIRNYSVQGAILKKTYDVQYNDKKYKVICFNSKKNLKENDTLDPLLLFIGGKNDMNVFAYWIPQ
jgi:hypothetical protein